MPRIFAAGVLCLPVVALVGLGLAGCGGHSTKTARSSNNSSSRSPTTSTPSESGTAAASTAGLSKAEFISAMNAVCTVTNTNRAALPVPTSETDYAKISANLEGTLLLIPTFISEAEALVGQSADKAELTAKWISFEKSDFAAIKPIAQRMVDASKAKDSAKVKKIGAELDAAPNHSEAMARFMTTYGLTACANLETS